MTARAPTERRSGEVRHEEISCRRSSCLQASHNLAAAQGGDHAQAIKLWTGPESQCRNCHGVKGEGGFGPDLAGRKLTAAQFTHAVRNPWGIMPAYIDSQISDNELALLARYFERDARGRAACQMAVRSARRRAARAGGCAHLRLRPVPRPDPQRPALAPRRHRCRLRLVQDHGLRPHHRDAGTREGDARTAAGAHPHGQLRADPDVGIAAADIYDWARDIGFRRAYPGTPEQGRRWRQRRHLHARRLEQRLAGQRPGGRGRDDRAGRAGRNERGRDHR